MIDNEVIDKTRLWISSVVIGLNLCPFAQRVFKADQIRYSVTDTDDQETLLQLLSDELTGLAQSVSVETTLLIHPKVLGNFLDYVDFLAIADQRLSALRLQGVIQIASFHPEYQFADTELDAVENYTNRSPYPMLHLLREESITKVATDPEALGEIPLRNKKLLKTMGLERVKELLGR
ncbi:MAG TPA: DUF1415 domain-containing protein [Gemmatales bacterium]|nr:DUF1415 domain-containing protein [Gemmatales bacterium]